MKRFLSVILAVIMLFGVLPLSAYAEDADAAGTGASIPITVRYDPVSIEVEVSWDPVPNAGRYILDFYNDYPDGSWPPANKPYKWFASNAGETSCVIDKYYLREYMNGGMNYKLVLNAYSTGDNVIATGEKIFRTEIPILAAPTEVKLSDTALATWRAVPGVRSYFLQLVDAQSDNPVSGASGTFSETRVQFSKDVFSGNSYYVRIFAYDNDYNYRNSKTVTSQITKIRGDKDDVSGLKWVGYTLRWDGYSNANRYALTLKKLDNVSGSSTYGQFVQKDTTQYTSKTSFDFLSLISYYGSGTYLVSIEAMNDSIRLSEVTEGPRLIYSQGSSDYTLSLSVHSFLSEEDTVKLVYTKKGSTVRNTVNMTGNECYYIKKGLSWDTYKMTVSKKNHAVYSEDIDVSLFTSKAITLHPIGDINGDGKVTNFDYSKVNQHVCKIEGKTLSGYELSCADVNSDGNVTNFDAGKINQHVCKVNSLWS